VARRSTGSSSDDALGHDARGHQHAPVHHENKVDVVVGSTITPNSLAMVDVVADAEVR